MQTNKNILKNLQTQGQNFYRFISLLPIRILTALFIFFNIGNS
jgi:hypothetical protein